MFDICLYFKLVWLNAVLGYYERAHQFLVSHGRATSQDALEVAWNIIHVKDARRMCKRRLRNRLHV